MKGAWNLRNITGYEIGFLKIPIIRVHGAGVLQALKCLRSGQSFLNSLSLF